MAGSTVDRDLFLPVAAQPTLDHLVEWGRRGEKLGYDHVWMPETWGRDVVTVLATLANKTTEVGLGTSIANVYSRSPALLGQTAATLQEASDGRLRLGVGPSGPILIEHWHGIEYGRPLRRTRETIEIIRAVCTGDPVRYEGDIFQLDGFKLRHGPPDSPPPIDAAGLRSKSVELAGRFGDGWHALMADPDGLDRRLEDFHRGAKLGGRNPSEQRVTVGLNCCALADRDRARTLAREHLVFYIASMGTFYRETLAEQGYEAEANTIASRAGSGDGEAAMAVLTDDMLDSLAIAGTPAECQDLLERYESVDGVDALAISFPRGATPEEIDSTIEALAP